MAGNKYVIGNTVYVTLTAQKIATVFPKVTYALYDPATLSFVLVDPLGVLLPAKVYGVDPDVHKQAAAVGEYWVVLGGLTVPGPWKWKWVDADSAEPALLQGSFTMSSPSIPA